MAEKARHAFGSSERIEESIASGVIDSYDILFLDGDTDSPKIGWIDKNGKPVILKDEKADLSEVKTEIAELETEMATKADTDEVEAKIGQSATDTVAKANSYTDEKLEAALGEYLAKKYEVAYKPEGTLVNYRDKEIRIMCPVDTKWSLQNSGENADANSYYIGFKAYAPENAVSFKEDTAETIADETMYYFENNEFAGIDTDSGRKYSIVWLPAARYDADNDTWIYFGANSGDGRYVGWYYSVEWYNADGKIITSDCIRISLSNEKCHSSIEPYYVGEMKKAMEVIEF